MDKNGRNALCTVGELIEKLRLFDTKTPIVVSIGRCDPVHLKGPIEYVLSKEECDYDAMVCEGREGQKVAWFWADNGF
jgi:hypothetical protein